METLVNYFNRVTGLTATKEQVEVLENLADITIQNVAICAGRGFSKSLMCAVTALWFADVYADHIGRPIAILLVSGQDAMYSNLDNIFHRNKDLRD